LQGITFEIEGTNNSGNLGSAVNINYTHRNLLKLGAVGEIKTQLSIERQAFLRQKNSEKNGFNTQNYLVDLKLTFPRLLTPFGQSKFIERSNPKTILNTYYNYEDRPEYRRSSANFSFEYFWKSADFMSNYLSVLRMSYIEVYDMADFFRQWLETTLMKESYENHFIIGPKYNVILSNQGKPGNNYYINHS
jgi:hypothetical protein